MIQTDISKILLSLKGHNIFARPSYIIEGYLAIRYAGMSFNLLRALYVLRN